MRGGVFGRLRRWLAMRARVRRLRRLQAEYLGGTRPDSEVIPEYFDALAAARDLDRQRQPAHAGPLVHLGSGGHHLDGWINVDVDFRPGLTVCADAAAGLPFRGGTVARIFSEDFLEHLEHRQAAAVLSDCRRVLRADGAIRAGVPDLEAIVRRVYLEGNRGDLEWCRTRFGDRTRCEALNRHMRMDGDHRFLYDWECLSMTMREAGFDVVRRSFHVTGYPEFRFVDIRGLGLSLFVEGTPRAG